jgi:ribosomal protein S18 acetylase RimI-like enzyme
VFNPTEVACVEELWNEFLADEKASGYSFLVAHEDGGPLLGYVCYGPHALTRGTYDLYWIAVSPEARGRGVGHALLAEAEKAVRVQDGRLMLIETSDTPPYEPARRLYESGGYHLEATVRDFYQPGDSLLVYAKHLQRAEGA